MIKINLKNPVALIYIISVIFMSSSVNLFADDDKYISGRVLYSDNSKPVKDGMIRVVNTNATDKGESIIEEAIIQSNGIFKIQNNPMLTSDGIKIMAYPNDVDNQENPFDPVTVDVKEAMTNSDEQFRMIIYVKRNKNLKRGEHGDILFQNSPNPFNPTTKISFELPSPSNVTLKIYNMRGESIATLIDNKKMSEGRNELMFDANGYPSGIYVYSLSAGNYSENKTMILLK